MLTLSAVNPQRLLDALKEGIRKGHITTWSEQNGYFTHTPSQWARKAWMLPSIYGSELRFAIVRAQGEPLTKEIYGVYHGRFLEMMLAHFDTQFSTGAATALATSLDRIAA